MMHRFKRALHVDDQQKLLAASDRLKAVDIELRRLLQQYPALQKNLVRCPFCSYTTILTIA